MSKMLLTLEQAKAAGCLIENLPLEDYEGLIKLAEKEMDRAEALVAASNPGQPKGFLKPSNHLEQDPRTGDALVFCPGRRLREYRRVGEFCIVEDCEISPIFAHRPLTAEDRYCFLNLNMFPILFPDPQLQQVDSSSFGLHFLFWPSNAHEEDFDSLSPEDIATGLSLVGELEKACLTSSAKWYGHSGQGAGGDHHGYFRIIRNSGRLVGGSVDHPHMQMLHGSVPDGGYLRDVNYFKVNKTGFGPALANQIPKELIVRDYGEYLWVVPPFARRALHSMIVPRNGEGGHLYEATDAQKLSLAEALKDFTRALPLAMQRMGRIPAHNLVFHTGPIGGMYVETFGHTQETGGVELAGMWVNMQTPAQSRQLFLDALKNA